MNYSLRQRLLVSASFILLCFLSFAGIALYKSFQNSVLTSAEYALRGHLFVLMSVIDVEEDQLIVPTTLPDGRFAQINSGLYAQITNDAGELLWQSASLGDERLNDLYAFLGRFQVFEDVLVNKDISRVHAMSLGVSWQLENDITMPLNLYVAESTSPYQQRTLQYRKTLWLWLGGLGLMLLLLQFALLAWSTRPLARMVRQISDIEQGRSKRFDNDYPHEVQKLTSSLNQLLMHEERQIEHQRNVLANLAHSLKTPVAVLRGMWSKTAKNSDQAFKQLDSMSDIIDYQLHRAATVGRRHFVEPILCEPEIKRIVESLLKVHKSKNVKVEINGDKQVLFYGEQGDLLEVAGNLLENAFKWCEKSINVNFNNISSASGERPALQIIVSDDGRGVEQKQRSLILKRGARADTMEPGHGLGLAIVKEIVDAYDGELSIDENKLKGARFAVILR